MVKSVGIHINKLEASHFAHFPALNSAWDTLLNPETGQVSEIKTRNPQTKVLARPYVRDQDYHALYLQGNPTEAGQWAANVVFSQRGRNPNADAWIVLNEPPCDTVEQVERLAQADIAYMKALEAQGLKAGIGAFSTGNLQIPRFDSARQVRAYESTFRYAAENGHYLVLHCYAATRPMMGGTAPSGWVHDPRYFGLRWHEEIFPYMRANGIPIPKTIIAEFGLDLGFAKKFAGYTGQYVGYRVAEPWGYGDSEAGARQYVDDLAPFAAELVKDSEVEGICIYCAGDNGDEKWRSFMVDGAMGYLASKAFSFPTQPQQPPATPPVPVPPTVERVRLRIPYASQLAPVDQANYGVGDCLQAVITQLARASGRVVTVNDVARLTGLPKGYLSSHIITHGVNVARQLGIRLLWAGRLEPEDLKEEIRAGRSVILRVWYPFLQKRFDLNYSQYHFITVHGFEGDKFFYDDPYWREKKDGEDIAITAAQLRRAAWRAAGGATPAQGLLVRGLELLRNEAA